MSTLAGVLLLFMDEEEAFWALSVLLTDKKFAMHGLFIEGILLYIYVAQFLQLIFICVCF